MMYEYDMRERERARETRVKHFSMRQRESTLRMNE
jgi:hypothetical protein